MTTIVVIDGQGGRMGSLFIEKILSKKTQEFDIIAVGTNSAATTAMLKAGASHGATGENPVVYNVRQADYVVGPVGIISADALYGEITEKMATAVAKCKAKKLLIPVNTCGIYIAGVTVNTLNNLVEDIVNQITNEKE